MSNDLDGLGADGYTAQELRSAMGAYNIPGGQEIRTYPASLQGDDGLGEDHPAVFTDRDFGLDDAVDFGGDDFVELSADELISLGWSPFKAIKKAVKSAAKVVSKPVSFVTKAVAKVPVVGKVASAGMKAGLKLANPLSILKPRALIKSQLNVAKQALPLAKALAKSPIVKTVVGGAAIVFPPVGLPAAGALVAVNAIVAATDSKVPGIANAAAKFVTNTAALAAKGDPGAKAALAKMAEAKRLAAAKGAVPLAKAIVKSPIIKATPKGAALVFPPSGVPAASALTTASALVKATTSTNAGVRASAIKMVQNTADLARSGDPGAQIALSQMATVKLASNQLGTNLPPGAKLIKHVVTNDGRIHLQAS